MEAYTFLQSYFTEPDIVGSNTSGLAQPVLQFYRAIEKPNGTVNLKIQVDFTAEGMASDFRFHVVTKSIFQVIDAGDIVVQDVYDMYRKAVDDLRAFLDYKIGNGGRSTIGVPMPEFDDVIDELIEFVGSIHSFA